MDKVDDEARVTRWTATHTSLFLVGVGNRGWLANEKKSDNTIATGAGGSVGLGMLPTYSFPATIYLLMTTTRTSTERKIK